MNNINYKKLGWRVVGDADIEYRSHLDGYQCIDPNGWISAPAHNDRTGEDAKIWWYWPTSRRGETDGSALVADWSKCHDIEGDYHVTPYPSKAARLAGLSSLSESLMHGNRETYRGYVYHAVPLDVFSDDAELIGCAGFDVYRISCEALEGGVIGYPDDTPYAWIDHTTGNCYRY